MSPKWPFSHIAVYLLLQSVTGEREPFRCVMARTIKW